jgi:hypothetical protein
MLLLRDYLLGKLPSSASLTDHTRRCLAEAALDCMAISGDGYLGRAGEGPTAEDIRQLEKHYDEPGNPLPTQPPESWPSWTRFLLHALHCIDAAANGASQDKGEPIRQVARVCIALAMENAFACRHGFPVAARASQDLNKWLMYYIDFGVLHYSIVADAIALRDREGAGDPADPKAVDWLIDRAYKLIDWARGNEYPQQGVGSFYRHFVIRTCYVAYVHRCTTAADLGNQATEEGRPRCLRRPENGSPGGRGMPCRMHRNSGIGGDQYALPAINDGIRM